ncbi:hypothetical protein M4I32_09985 [Microbacterium sp. LRZ72]|uniref:hypothetical protein n=1 Tax=Microbacterium sp. LRZ72 TaxID=2942481 RepID=UPI0029AEFFD7|nr:hypothetical protein [Microbacterium sp. LRZ72]MDX2377128.1 hypothetical protein [Microbacterium sp. LRZ72]
MSAITSNAGLTSVPRVNLMPRAERERRSRAALTRGWAWAMVGALAVVAVAGGAAFVLKLTADQQLVAEQAETSALLGQMAELSEVSTALADTERLGAFRAEAMATHLGWSDALSTLQTALPGGVAITDFELAAGAAPAGDAAAADPAAGLSGTLTLTSAAPVDMADTIRAVRDVSGVLSADGRDLASTGDGDAARVYTYILGVELDQSVYTGAYAAEEER